MKSKPRRSWKLIVGLVVMVCGWGMACDLKGDKAQEDLTIVVEADRSKLTEQEKQLSARLDEFEKERERMRAEREDLMKAKEQIKDKDADQAKRIKEKELRLWSKERSMWKRESALDKEKKKLDNNKTSLLSMPVSRAGIESSMPGREADMASRESSLAGREKELSRREARVAEREAALAVREKGLANPRIITVPQPISGSGRVSKKVAKRAYRRALKAMSGKGILSQDLPPELQGVKADIKKALNKKDYRSVRDLSEQLRAALSAMVVDEGFIKRKFANLNSLSRKNPPKDSTKKKKVKSLLRTATQLVADGQFKKANRSLNRIYSLLRR